MVENKIKDEFAEDAEAKAKEEKQEKSEKKIDMNELIEKGQEADFEQILADIKERDFRDSNRAVAPLKPAEDAILFNNTGYTPEQSLCELLGIVKDRLGISEVQYEK